MEHKGLRDLIHTNPPIDPGRTPAEEKARVALPGDSVELPQNPFLRKNPQFVMRVIKSGVLKPEHERLARQAIQIYQLSTLDRDGNSESVGGGMRRPGK